MNKINSDISKNIKKYRKLNKMTQKELSQKVGVSIAAVSNWETGANSIDVDTLFKVCDALNVSITEISDVKIDFELNAEEKEIIENYRKARDWEKLTVLQILHCVHMSARKRHYWDIVNEINEKRDLE